MEVEDRSNDKRNAGIGAQGPRALGVDAATVLGPKPDAEVSLIGQGQWQAIHERRAAGVNISAIAREFELDRKTVRSCLSQLSWQPYRREPPTPTLLDAHRAWLVERAPQVHHSARILWQELRSQRGFAGCYETVKLHACAERRWRRRAQSGGYVAGAHLRLGHALTAAYWEVTSLRARSDFGLAALSSCWELNSVPRACRSSAS